LRTEETSTQEDGKGGRRGGATAAEEGWLVSPSGSEGGEGGETAGHVEPSYVLTCPSPPPPLSLTNREGECKRGGK